jgi:hypothetical protein
MLKTWQLAVILLGASLLITAILWSIGLPFFFLFIFIPLIPFLRQDRVVKRCPVCGWETTGREKFCPYDGSALIPAEDGTPKV